MTYLSVLDTSVLIVEPSVIEVTVSASSGLLKIVRVNRKRRMMLSLINDSVRELDE